MLRTTLILLTVAVGAAGCGIREMRTITVPAGTRLIVSLNEAVAGVDAGPDAAYEARVLTPVAVGGITVIPAGTIVRAVVDPDADGALTCDRFQNARGRWQDLPVVAATDGRLVAPAPAGGRMKMVTRSPMSVPVL